MSKGDRAIELAAKEMLDRGREKARARDQMEKKESVGDRTTQLIVKKRERGRDRHILREKQERPKKSFLGCQLRFLLPQVPQGALKFPLRKSLFILFLSDN